MKINNNIKDNKYNVFLFNITIKIKSKIRKIYNI